MKVDLYHNILWSRYKARVFSSLSRLSSDKNKDFRFFQIAETDGQRLSLSSVDMAYHQYPHELLFPGSYGDISKLKLACALFIRVFRSDAELVLMPGFDKPEYWSMLLASICSGKRRATFCDSTLYDRPQHPIKGVLKKLFFAHCHGVFCYGQRAREYLIHYGTNADRIHQRCQAAALPDDYSVESARATRLRMAASDVAPRYLYVGRLSQEKSLDILLKAFVRVRSDIPAAQLIIVGGGPLAASLQQQAATLGLSNSVEFAGGMGQDALAEEYARATCLVLPSRSEPWGLVVNEALHYGCPVVVSDHCGCVPELVQGDRSGHTFETDNVESLADALLLLTSKSGDPGLVADRCFEVISNYTPDRAAEQIMRGCEVILQAKASAA